jgi:hypothetical protein
MVEGAEEKIEGQEEVIEPKESLTPGEGEEGSQEQKDELDNDQEYQKASKDFNNHPRFRQIYKGKRDAERRVTELQEQLDSLSNQEEPELSDNELVQLAQRKGYQLTKAQVQQMGEGEKDELEELFKTAQPQEREWWGKYNQAIENKFAKKYDSVISELIINHRLNQSEVLANNFISKINEKYNVKLDYKKDIEPEIKTIIRASKGNLNPSNMDILRLTKEVLAEKGIEIGKRLSEKENKELISKKKLINMETPEPSAGGKTPDNNKSFDELFEESKREEGLLSWR